LSAIDSIIFKTPGFNAILCAKVVGQVGHLHPSLPGSTTFHSPSDAGRLLRERIFDDPFRTGTAARAFEDALSLARSLLHLCVL
jgi:hypothetical protein